MEINNAKISYGDIGSREAILARDGWKCFYCEQPFSVNMDGYNNMTVDHKVAKAKNGIHHIENLVISCRNCNSAKSDLSIDFDSDQLDEFRKRRRLLRQRDEEFVKLTHEYVKTANENNLDVAILNEEKITEELVERLKTAYQKVTVSNSNPKYIDFFDNDKEWTFILKQFALQPFFIHKADYDNKTVIDDSINTELEKLFYIKGSTELRTKYIKPFFNAMDGFEIIKREINVVNEIWRY